LNPQEFIRAFSMIVVVMMMIVIGMAAVIAVGIAAVPP
jgi:hypothetical protein